MSVHTNYLPSFDSGAVRKLKTCGNKIAIRLTEPTMSRLPQHRTTKNGVTVITKLCSLPVMFTKTGLILS